MKKFILLSALALCAAPAAFASADAAFTFQGRVLKANGADPVEAASVLFKVQIRSHDGLCLLYEETHLRDMTGTSGVFALTIGSGTNGNVSALSLAEVFDNSRSKNGSSCTYTPSVGDVRKLRLSWDDGVEVVSLPMDQAVGEVPSAYYARSLDGLGKNDFLKVHGTATQTNVETLTGMLGSLSTLASGNSTAYAKTSDLPMSGGILDLTSGGLRVPASPATSDSAVSKSYVDAAVAASLPNTGTSGTYTKVTTDAKGRVISGAALSASDIPDLSWSKITSGFPHTLTGYGITDAVKNLGGAPGIASGVDSAKGSGGTLGRLFLATDTGRIYRDDGSGWDTVASMNLSDMSGSVNLASLPVSSLAKGGTGLSSGGTANQILGMNLGASGLEYKTVTAGSGVTISHAANSLVISASGSGGTVTSVSVTAPLTVATASTTPALALASGSGTGQHLIWSGSAWSAAFANASELRGVAGAAQLPTTCTSAQVWAYQSVTDTFACTSIAISNSQVSGLGTAATKNIGTAAGTVAAGDDSRIVNAVQTSSLGGAATLDVGTSAGTVAAGNDSRLVNALQTTDTGTTAGKILKLDSSARIPAVDGSLLTGIASTQVSGLGTAATKNVGTASGTVAAGDDSRLVNAVQSSSLGTAATLNTGTAAGNVVKLDASAKLPAVDGSQLTNLPIPFSNRIVVSATGDWTPPAGVTRVYVQVWGGGGGGAGGSTPALASGGGSGGGGGAFAEGVISLTDGNPVTVTIGTGGPKGGSNSAGTDGGDSKFGAYLVAPGGKGGVLLATTHVLGGVVGAVANTVHHIVGGYGLAPQGAFGGFGGAAYGGSNAPGSVNTTTGGMVGIAPGGGGGGGYGVALSASGGGNGAAGRVVIWY